MTGSRSRAADAPPARGIYASRLPRDRPRPPISQKPALLTISDGGSDAATFDAPYRRLNALSRFASGPYPFATSAAILGLSGQPASSAAPPARK